MSMIYKLGEGPINYDWNPRYVSIEGTEIFYSPSQNDSDRKTINVYEGAVSNICKIKGKNFAFCVILPPPTNKSLFFAADSYNEILTFRNNALKATLNSLDNEKDERILTEPLEMRIKNTSFNYPYNKFQSKLKTNYLSKENPNINLSLITQMFSQSQEISEEFRNNLEQLKNEIILNESKFISKFKGGLKVSIPINHLKIEYLEYFKNLIFKIIKIIITLFLLHGFFKNLLFENQNTIMYYFFNLIELICFYVFIKNLKKITFLNPLNLKSLNPQDSNSKCDYIVKTSTLFEGDKNEILSILCNPKFRSEWDYFIKENKDILINESHTNKTNPSTNIHNNFSIKFSFPVTSLFSNFYANYLSSTESIQIETIKYVDCKNNYYVAFREKSENQNSLKFDSSNFFELFILVPVKDIDEEKTLVIFITNFDAGNMCKDKFNLKSKKFQIPFFISQQIKEERLNILSTLKEFLKVSYVNIKSDDFENIFDTQRKSKFESENKGLNMGINFKKLNNGHILDKNKILIEEPNIEFNTEAQMDTVRSCKSEYNDANETHHNHNYPHSHIDRDTEIHPDSIITHGQRVTLEERLPGYLKNSEGGVECRNYEELRAQEGIVLEVMKRASKQLIEGKNMVAVSLPVRIFEPRSTLSRITDIWGAGPHFFDKISNCCDKIERMKLWISFAISGMYMNLKQLKPFNPILGETYQAYWPDGSKFYVEHISHHPPISRFLILSANKSWKFYGHYEYIAKLKSLTGNSFGGQFRGPNRLELKNGDILTFSYPVMNITGLMYGRRIMEWEGYMEFSDYKNDISANLEFTPAPKFYQKFKEPTDVFRGDLKKGDKCVHKIFGSPIDKLVFDNELFWEFETTDIIKANDTKESLPSDCRFRSDLIALASGNLQLAEQEKLRLEVLQRADRALRQKYNKSSH